MTESNNYCKKNKPNTQTSNWRSFVFELETFESESQARLGILGKRVARSSWGVSKQLTVSSNDISQYVIAIS